jgi:hypothetical protein
LVRQDILARRQRGDFAAYADAEAAWGFFCDLITALCHRTARTYFSCIKAHAGDPANGISDALAGLACYVPGGGGVESRHVALQTA